MPEHGLGAIWYIGDDLGDGENGQWSDSITRGKHRAVKGAKGKKVPTSFTQTQAFSSGVSQIVAALLLAFGKVPQL